MKRWLLANLGWKLLSVAIAALLWYLVVGEPRYGAAVSAPLLLRNMPPDLEISSERPEKISLELQGTPGQLDQEHLSGVAAILDLASVTQPGERTFSLTRDNVRIPRGVHFVRAIPSQVRLYFERRKTTAISVRPRFAGGAPPGYLVRRFQVDPPQVRIAGPESHVSRIAFAETDAIDLSGVIGEKAFVVTAFVEDPQVRFEDSPQVTVRVEVTRAPGVGDR